MMNQYQEQNCSKGRRMANSDSGQEMEIAMAYVPWQFFQSIYEPDKALQVGTVFPELNKPFYGGKGGGMRR